MSTRFNRWLGLRYLAAVLMCAIFCGSAVAGDWPQELTFKEGTVIVYQPQPEAISGNTLTGRAAMSIELADGGQPIFGVFWFSADISTDRDRDIATISRVKVTKVTWPDSKDTAEQRFTSSVENALKDGSFDASLSGLKAALAVSDKVQQSLEEINNDPPNIEFIEQLAVLLLFDGEPRFSPVENSAYERAMNTPLAVVRDTRSKKVYLTSGALWYQSASAIGPWEPTSSPPSDLVALIDAGEQTTPESVPVIVTATEPTELVVSQGAPDWVSLEGGELLYVRNTETPWIRDLAGGNMYIQLAGRWYRGKEQKGPWTFVRGDKLPDSFTSIPPASDIGGVRTSVAGTDEANEAIADAQIPQTAVIDRDKASLTVQYDGKPDFEKIKGTDVAYAVNTGAQVLRIDGQYYAVDNGVWFVAPSAEGPWQVADSIPDDKLAEIPPSSPVYNTTYVKVYQSTPEVVYVGYTPGYMWSFPYYGVPVYGTGWYYPPYWGGYYYPRPPTWGFHVGYNPWTGWNFGVSWGGPFFRVGVSWGGGWGGGYYPGRCCYGRYGGGYRHNDININTGDINIGNNVNVGNRNKIENRMSNRPTTENLYDRKNNQQRNADRTKAQSSLQKARSNPQRKNDVFADRSGQVARREGDQWQVRQNDRWNNVQGGKDNLGSHDSSRVARDLPEHTRPASGNRSQLEQRPQIDHHRMNRDFNARARGGGMHRRR